MTLQKPLIDRIREARTVDAACPYVRDDMTAAETAAIAYWWRRAMDAAALMHREAEDLGLALLLGDPPGRLQPDVEKRLALALAQLNQWIRMYDRRVGTLSL